MNEKIREAVTAVRNARAAGDAYAVGVLSAYLEGLVAESRDRLLTGLEAELDRLQEAERRGDRVAVNALFPGFERALVHYERLCDRIRASEYLPDSLSVAGEATSGVRPGHDTKTQSPKEMQRG